ncbi:MAG: hypothetical protein ACLFTT_10120 [Candidatus Hydrogenedentota bacterium]
MGWASFIEDVEEQNRLFRDAVGSLEWAVDKGETRKRECRKTLKECKQFLSRVDDVQCFHLRILELATDPACDPYKEIAERDRQISDLKGKLRDYESKLERKCAANAQLTKKLTDVEKRLREMKSENNLLKNMDRAYEDYSPGPEDLR